MLPWLAHSRPVGRTPVHAAMAAAAAVLLRPTATRATTCQLRWAAGRRQCRHSSAAPATAAALQVKPEGTLTVRTNALDLSIATETEHCDIISFESCVSGDLAASTGTASAVADLHLSAEGENSAQLVARSDASLQPWASDSSADRLNRPSLRGLIPAKYLLRQTTSSLSLSPSLSPSPSFALSLLLGRLQALFLRSTHLQDQRPAQVLT